MKGVRFIRSILYSSLALIGGLGLGYSTVHTAWSLGIDPYKDFDIFTHVFHIIENKHLEQPSSELLIHSAIDGMVDQLDEHSWYIPPEQYKLVQREAEGWSVGIGIEINTEHTILRVLPSSPAAIAGLMAGDQLTQIDGTSIKRKSVVKIQQLLKGEIGSIVKVYYQRDGIEMEQEIIRDHFLLANVEIFDLGNKNVYIQLNRFKKGCVQEIRTKLQDLYPLSKISGVILDLRDNPGGFVEDGVRLVDLFLEKGTIITVEGQQEKQVASYEAEKNSTDIIDAELIILINKNSASASEITAGSLQAHKRAKLIGTKSFGKGSMQQMFEFTNGSALKLTISKYVLPNGHHIDKKTPLVPDVFISNQLEDPKKELINSIKALDIPLKKKKFIIQRLSMLSNHRSSAPIPRSEDFQYRLDNDPQLKTAWNHLINSSSSNE